MRPLKMATDPQSRAGEIRTLHPDIPRLLDVFARLNAARNDCKAHAPVISISRPRYTIL